MLGSDLHGTAMLLLALWPLVQGLQQVTSKDLHEAVGVGVVMDGTAGVEWMGLEGAR